MAYTPTADNYFFPQTNVALGAMTKNQVDQAQVQLDYSTWLNAGETVTGVSFSMKPGTVPPLICSNVSISANTGVPPVPGSLVSFFLSQGANQVSYQLSITATTSANRTKTDQLTVVVNNGAIAAPVCAPGGFGGFGGYPGAPPGAQNTANPPNWNSPYMPPSPLQQQANLFNGNNTLFASSYVQFTVAASAPQGPNILDFWYNTTDGNLYQYITDGSSAFWITVMSPLARSPICVVAASAPSVSGFQIGDLWYNSSTTALSILANNGSANVWVSI